MPRSPTKGPPPEPEFYVDANLGKTFVSTLRTHGPLRVSCEEDVFPQERPKDIDWIPRVAEQGWVVITQDQLNPLDEQAALLAHGVKVFVLVGRASHTDLALLFLSKIRWIRRSVAEHDQAFLAKIYYSGASPKLSPASEILARCARRWGRQRR